MRDSSFRVRTHSAAIQKLMSEHISSQKCIASLREEKAAEKERIRHECLDIGPEMKQRFSDLADTLGIRSPAAALDFLIEHFNNSPSIDKATLNLLLHVRR